MKKIPTMFVRDPDDRAHVLDEVHPGCTWVTAGEGTPTRKYDGTCVMFDGGDWWARREIRPGKEEPAGWVETGTDDVTGKRVGWEPIRQSPFAKFHAEAAGAEDRVWDAGTYELCGPKVNGNPEGFAGHVLIEHASAQELAADTPRNFAGLRSLLRDNFTGEGIVWHHPDGRMAKIKRRDFA